MLYLFRKYNRQIAVAAGAAAWEMFSSNGDWKFKPIYLGAIPDERYKKLKARVQEELPISPELYERVNSGDDKSADRELRKIQTERTALHTRLLDELVGEADTSVAPPNMDIVNNDALPPEYRNMARNMRGNE